MPPPKLPNGCPNCKSRQMAVDADLWALVRTDTEDNLDLTKHFKVGIVACRDCGMSFLLT